MDEEEVSGYERARQREQVIALLALRLVSADAAFRILEHLENPIRVAPRPHPLLPAMQTLDSDTFRKSYRFRSYADFMRVFQALKVPEEFKGTGIGRCYSYNGVELFAVFLLSLSRPRSHSELRLKDVDWSEAKISNGLRLMTEYLYGKFGLLVIFSHRTWTEERCDMYSTAISGAGSPLPNIVAFVDGTVKRICRPSGDSHQRAMLNGHKRYHALTFQSLLAPSGIIGGFAGPNIGSAHDSPSLRLSETWEKFTSCVPSRFRVYGDSAYRLGPRLIKAIDGENQAVLNTAMSSLRQSVEWPFGHMYILFSAMNHWSALKIRKSHIGKKFVVVCLLYNCYVSLYGNIVSRHFHCTPLPLEEYLSE